MKYSRTFRRIALLGTLVAFSGCGGGSSGGGDTGEGTLDFQPVVAYTCSDTATISGMTVEEKSGANGKITYDCVVRSPTHGVHLASGTTSLTATDLDTEEYAHGTIDGKSTEILRKADYKTGRVTYTGSLEGYGSIDCTETYQSILPVTVYDDEELHDLLNFDFDRGNPAFISTTCPEWFYEADNDSSRPAHMNMILADNYTLQDDGGGTSLVSTWRKVVY